jgi:hypothetical protein
MQLFGMETIEIWQFHVSVQIQRCKFSNMTSVEIVSLLIKVVSYLNKRSNGYSLAYRTIGVPAKWI